MSSSHQNIINEDNKPPGNIYKNKYWTFPKIKKEITRGSVTKISEWIIIVELYEYDKIIELSEDYFNNSLLQDDKYNALYYTISGDQDGKKTTSKSTNISTGKNIGKKNQTNVFTQALMDARSKYNKKLNETSNSQCSDNIDNNDDINDQDDDKCCDNEKKIKIYAPMLLHVYEDKRIDFTKDYYYIQKKSDGLRALYNNEIMWSRQKKIFPKKDYLINELSKMLKEVFYVNGNEIDNSKLYLDGELYKHGIPLEEINSIARSSSNKEKLEYHIFDVFYPSIKMAYNDRLSLLNTMFQAGATQLKYIKLVETHQVHDENDIKKLYKYYVENNKYEGLVIRSGLGLYNLSGGRSYDVLKIKKRIDEDMVLISYTASKTGKEKDAIIFIVDPCIKDYKEKLDRKELKKILSGKEFNVVPNWTIQKRKELFYKLEDDPDLFDKLYYGASIRIQFDCYSQKGIPLRAKAINLLLD